MRDIFKFRYIPRRLLARMAVLATLVLGGILLATFTPLGDYFNEQQLLAWLDEFRQVWWTPLLLIGLYVGVSAVGLPPGPLLVGGAAFGALYGSLYNVTGLVLGAAVGFLVARWLGRDFVLHMTGYRLARAERYFQRFGFWPLVHTRFLPLPFPVINFAAAFAGVPVRLFLVTSLVGLLPSTIIHTYFIAELLATQGQERLVNGVAYVAALVIFNLVIGWTWMRARLRRRKRYHQLLKQRAARHVSEPLNMVPTSTR